MAINQLTVFAQNGEKNTNGLNQADGFPAAEKPKRQWFNWLLNTLTSKINEIATQVNSNTEAIGNLDGSVGDLVDLIYPVGIVIDFGSAGFNPNNHFSGTTWVPHGEGKTPVGLSTQAGDPAWTKTVGNVFGEFEKTITVNNLPEHDHEFFGDDDAVPSTVTKVGTVGGSDTQNTAGGGAMYKTSKTGGNQPMNIVQPSIIEARWLRTA